MANGQFVTPSGRRLVAPSGRRVWSTPTTPCCCGDPACPTYHCDIPLVEFCDCLYNANPYSVVCCETVSGSVTLTMPTFIPASGYASQPYASVIDDIMTNVSGESITIPFGIYNTSAGASKYGKVCYIDLENCIVGTWLITIVKGYDFGGTMDAIFDVQLSIVFSAFGAPWTLGDNFPCTNNDGIQTHRSDFAPTLPAVVSLSYSDSTNFGNCIQPDDGIVDLANFNPDYFDNTAETVGVGAMSKCAGSPTDASGFPEELTVALSACYPGLPSLVLERVDGDRLVLAYHGEAFGTVGSYEYYASVDISCVGVLYEDDCVLPVACCFAITFYIEVWDPEWDPESEDDPIIASCTGSSYLCNGFSEITGTYTGDLTIGVSS